MSKYVPIIVFFFSKYFIFINWLLDNHITLYYMSLMLTIIFISNTSYNAIINIIYFFSIFIIFFWGYLNIDFFSIFFKIFKIFFKFLPYF